MRKNIRKIAAVLLALVLLVGLLPAETLASGGSGSVHVTVENTTYSTGAWTGTLADTWVEIGADSTALSAISDALAAVGASDTVTTSAWGSYVSAVSSVDGGTLTQGDAGGWDGWMISLNDWFPDQAISSYTVAAGTLKSGDQLRLVYSMDGGSDVGANWSNTDKNLSSLTFSTGTLEPAFSGSVTQYTLTVSDGTESVLVTPTAANKNLKTGVFVGPTEYGRTSPAPAADGTVLTVTCGTETTYTITIRHGGQTPGPGTTGDVETWWPSFRGNGANMGVTSAETPDSAASAGLLWSQKLGEGWSAAPSDAIIADGALIVLSGSSISKLNLKTGEVMQTTSLAASINWGYTPATCGAGMIFVPLDGGKVQALDAKTLQSLWVYTDSLGGQAISPITYSDGFVYTGFWNGETGNADFVCLSVTDEDPNSTGEAKTAEWTYTKAGGFYWAGAVVVGGAVIVGSDDGVSESSGTGALYAFDRLTGKMISSCPVTGDVRSSVAYDEGSGKIYFTTKAGYLYSADVDASTGTVANLKGQSLGTATTSTPVVYKGSVYIGAAGGSTGGQLLALDADTLTILYSLDLPGYPQCSLLLSAASEQETGFINLYATCNKTPGGITLIRVKSGASSAADASVTELYGAAGYENYCVSSVICGPDGTLYYKNDSGYVMAVGISDVQKVISLINKIGTVTADSKAAIQSARTAYDALTDTEKARVTNYGTLIAAEADFAALTAVQPAQPAEAESGGTKTSETTPQISAQTGTGEKQESGTKAGTKAGTGAAAADSAAGKVIAAITAMKSANASTVDVSQVVKAYQAYQALTESQKKQVTNAAELDRLTALAGEKNHTDEATGITVDGPDWYIRLEAAALDASGDEAAALQKITKGKPLLVWKIGLVNLLTGEDFEPEEPVTVTVPAPDAGGYDGVVIVHEKADGTAEYIDSTLKDGKLTFRTSFFSTYAVEGYTGQSPLEVPQTESRGTGWVLWACLAAVLAIAVAFVAARLRRNKTENR